MKSYLSQVTKNDGIDQKEAILLAQSQVIFRGYAENYYLDKPLLVFDKVDRYGIKFFPRYKNLSEMRVYPKVLVVVQKKDGRIRFYRTER